MTPAARHAAAIGVLDDYLRGEPVEKLLSNWARKNRYAGSKDRAAVRDIVFDCLRNQGRCFNLSGIEEGRGLVIGQCLVSGTNLDDIFTGEGYGPPPLSDVEKQAVASGADTSPRANFPPRIADILAKDLVDAFEATCAALSTRAPVDLRVNLAKTSPDQAIQMLQSEEITAERVDGVETALRVTQNPRRISGSKTFAQGHVELQDAASQAVVNGLTVSSDMSILDYCAGGGGKTLALAALAPKAQIAAWDINATRLDPLNDRAKRAGARVQVLKQPPTRNTYDLVLVDAPCSGSGAWRRNPEGKWRLTQDRLQELQTIQADVLQKASRCVLPRGTLVYVTCSIFTRENRDQVDHFLRDNPNFTLQNDHSFPVNAPGDGFYVAIFEKQP